MRDGCTRIYAFKLHALINGIEISVALITLNAVMQLLIAVFISKIGLSSQTLESQYMQLCMYTILFFNTGVVMMLVGANLQGRLPLFGTFFDGEHHDFTSQWFVIIGTQVVLNSFGDLVGPPIAHYFNEIFFQVGMCLDQGRCRNKKRYPRASETRCRTISEYWETYAGPIYIIENGQAAMLNFITTCFLFGAGVPLLFPIAFLCLVILYIFEKKTICKQVRKPADYDPHMNHNLVRILLNGPILYSAFGYWMYSNPALTNTKEVKPLEKFWESKKTEHFIVDAFLEVTPATPFLILFCISVFAKMNHSYKIIKRFGKGPFEFLFRKQ